MPYITGQLHKNGLHYIKIHATYLDVVARVEDHKDARARGVCGIGGYGYGKIVSFKIE